MIHRLPIPTPWSVGAVNCYLVEDEPLTLVDTGPNWARALHALEEGLGEHGRRVEDLERIVLTHHHPDHEGLLEVLRDRSGAEVCALEAMASWLADWAAQMQAEDEHAAALMRRHGVHPDVVAVLEATAASFRAWGSSAPVDAALADGATLSFAARAWTVHHRPGHSWTDTVFHDAARREAIGGDHLLAHISSNPLASKDQARPLVNYLASLRATGATEDLQTVLPGHGEPVGDPRALVAKRLRMHDRRAGKLAALLADGPLSAHAMARRFWRGVAVSQPFLCLSEVLGHLDVLVERGEVARDDDGEVTVFRQGARVPRRSP